MPLIILSGLPKSGKSTRTTELSKHFLERGKNVIVISENEAVPKAELEKNDFFNDSQKEKQIRSYLKSEVTRQLTNDNLIILDAGNYIKGYRYELYCVSKSARTTQCTVFCGITKERAWDFNTKLIENNANEMDVGNNSHIPYSREIFDALVLRYEEPCGNNRWDSPLFTVFPETELRFDDIYRSLYECKPPPPNQSTQNPPLSDANYLFELDKLTQEIIGKIISARKIGILGAVQIQKDLTVNVPSDINAMQLNRLRRQFLNYNKSHGGTVGSGGSNLDKVPQLFAQFLNSNFSK